MTEKTRTITEQVLDLHKVVGEIKSTITAGTKRLESLEKKVFIIEEALSRLPGRQEVDYKVDPLYPYPPVDKV